MIDEAVKCGLKVDTRTVNTLAWGRQRLNSPFSYVAPSYEAMLHHSLHGAWWLLEFFPKNAKYREWPDRKTISAATSRTPNRGRSRKGLSFTSRW